MIRDVRSAALDADNPAIGRQERRLYERSTAAPDGQPAEVRVSGSAPEHQLVPVSADIATEPPSSTAILAPFYAENARLIDLVHSQAKELHALRERVRQLEVLQARLNPV